MRVLHGCLWTPRVVMAVLWVPWPSQQAYQRTILRAEQPYMMSAHTFNPAFHSQYLSSLQLNLPPKPVYCQGTAEQSFHVPFSKPTACIMIALLNRCIWCYCLSLRYVPMPVLFYNVLDFMLHQVRSTLWLFKVEDT